MLCDVSQEDQVAAMVERAVAKFGRLDMAFNNAGVHFCSGYPRTFMTGTSAGCLTVASCA